jgi:hypothetical protein
MLAPDWSTLEPSKPHSGCTRFTIALRLLLCRGQGPRVRDCLCILAAAATKKWLVRLESACGTNAYQRVLRRELA